jgi:hypothetical protein
MLPEGREGRSGKNVQKCVNVKTGILRRPRRRFRFSVSPNRTNRTPGAPGVLVTFIFLDF